jgi:regulator of cell morphogenesis and NO signaling
LSSAGVISLDHPVGWVILEHPRCARLLVERDIDFCCRGTMSLREACAAGCIDPEMLLGELLAVAEEEPSARLDPRALSTLQLVAHVVDQHHAYLRRTLPLVELLAARVVEAHAGRDPRLAEVFSILRGLRAFVDSHLDREEVLLFPLLIQGRQGRRLREELDWMQAEHLRLGDTLRKIRILTEHFVPPPWACATYAALLAELEALDRDTLEHVHLENNVLAPRFDADHALAPAMQRRRAG